MDLPQLLTIKNGTPVKHTFSDAEYASRLKKLRAHMASEGLDAVLFTSYHNINYYSDWLFCAFGRSAGLVVTADGATTISPNIDYGWPYRRTACGDNITYTDWHRDNFFVAVKKLIPDSAARVGVEDDYMSIEIMHKLQGALPTSQLLDVSRGCMRMRMIKSDEEIKQIKESARVADVGGAAAAEAIAVGVPEYEVALHSTQAMVREIGKSFPDVDIQDTWTWFQSGINTDGAHNAVTARKIERGDILSINCFPMPAGYYTALERTMFAEEVSDAHLKYWKINVDLLEKGKEMIKPGARCCDIANDLNKIAAAHGVLNKRTFGYGHSFGVLSHYYGREAGLELREDIETVLEPNMVVSMEPMITIPDGEPGEGGYREHDILVVTKDGAECITGYPYGPEHNIIKK